MSLHGVGGMYFTVGLGADPAMRDGLPPEGQDGNGWLLCGTPGKATWQPVAGIVLHDELVMSGGLALRSGDAYVSNCGVCPGGDSFLQTWISTASKCFLATSNGGAPVGGCGSARRPGRDHLDASWSGAPMEEGK